MEDVKPVLAKKGEQLKQRTKILEETVRELSKKIKALEECKACSKIKELNETLSKLQEKMKPKPDYWMNSTILADNAFYQSRLHQFLTPAVGSHPQWVLCYRASTHGLAARTFHSRCDGKRDTVTIIKKEQYVFGGYTDIPWVSDTSGRYGYTSNAFIFSLRNKEGMGPFKSMVKKPQYAIYRHSGFGPTFGGGHDIYITDNANNNTYSYTNRESSYSIPSGVQDGRTILDGAHDRFTPDNWEVFYLG
ncbi:hypothetical protein ACROYT_G031066 [Oculina patagonica]